MSRRRANGQGTVYLRKDGRWEGAGYVLTADGGARRVRLYGATRAEAQARLDESLGQSASGIPVGGATMAAFITTWLLMVAVHRLRVTTFETYRHCLEAFIVPGLGDKLVHQLTTKDVRAWIAHPDYEGERLVACRNLALAEHRAHKRQALLAATEETLAPIVAAVAEGRLTGAGKIGLKVGKVLGKYKMAKHSDIAIADTNLIITRNQASIDAEAALDGIYVIRTSAAADKLDAADVRGLQEPVSCGT